MFDLKKMLEGALAQANPFDGGKTFSSVNRPQQGQRPPVLPAAAMRGAATPRYEDEMLVNGQQGYHPMNSDVANFNPRQGDPEDATLVKGQQGFMPLSSLSSLELLNGTRPESGAKQGYRQFEDDPRVQMGMSPLSVNQQPYGGSRFLMDELKQRLQKPSYLNASYLNTSYLNR